MVEEMKEKLRELMNSQYQSTALYNRGLDVIEVTPSLKKMCIIRIYLQRLPAMLIILVFAVVTGYLGLRMISIDFANMAIMYLVVFMVVVPIFLLIFLFIQQDNMKLLTGNFQVYGAMCVSREERESGDASYGLFQSQKSIHHDQNSHGFFILANGVNLGCHWESYKHTEKGRYMYVVEVNNKRTWRRPLYYFINAPKEAENSKHGEYRPEEYWD